MRRSLISNVHIIRSHTVDYQRDWEKYPRKFERIFKLLSFEGNLSKLSSWICSMLGKFRNWTCGSSLLNFLTIRNSFYSFRPQIRWYKFSNRLIIHSQTNWYFFDKLYVYTCCNLIFVYKEAKSFFSNFWLLFVVYLLKIYFSAFKWNTFSFSSSFNSKESIYFIISDKHS